MNRKMTLTETGANRYRTRMMSAGDPVTMDGPSSRMWERMGWATEYRPRLAKRPQLDHDNNGTEALTTKQGGGEIKDLRAAYKDKFGKRPFNGWDADTLRGKLDTDA